ncbi:unnamed protein product [Parajaminaea phylloscopi]
MAPTATATSASSDSNAVAVAGVKNVASPSLEIVLDYPELADPARRPHFVSELRKAMVGLGFFYLRDSPLQEDKDRLFRLAKDFFDKPVQERRKIAQEQSRHFRGWSEVGTEHTLGKADNREQIDCGIESPEFPIHFNKPEYLNLYGPNQFPNEELRDAVLSYMLRCEEVTIALTSGIEEALGVEAGRLQNILGLEHKAAAFESVQALTQSAAAAASSSSSSSSISPQSVDLPEHLPYERLKLVKYGRDGNEQGVGAHRDGGWITLLSTDGQPGLQVEDLSGAWLDVPDRPRCILVNFGQQLERVSGNLIRAATHRVHIYPSPSGRISIPYFSVPSLRAIVVPLDPATQVSSEVLEAWREAQQVTQGKGRKSSVPEGDLHGGSDTEFGEMAWAGLVRSHPAVTQRWHSGAGTGAGAGDRGRPTVVL